MLSAAAALALLAAPAALALPAADPAVAALPIEAVSAVGRVHIPHRLRARLDAAPDFDVLHHLSGDSPYFNSPGVGLTDDVPAGCAVTRAAYLVRHGDIYANDFEYENQLAPFLYKLGNFTNRAGFAADATLAFLANWTSPIDDPEEQIEKVTPYGKRDALALGQLVAQRYGSIMNSTGPFRVWSAAATRDEDTSKAFVQGFNSTLSSLELVTVDEGEEQAANTLTPHESCPAFSSSAGTPEQDTFTNIYAPPAAARLNALLPTLGFNWTATDVFAAQALCGYETAARGASAFCGAFREEEWLGFEYANDVKYHRQLGYGSTLAPSLGVPWLAASARLLAGTANATAANSSAATQQLWISFTHREEPPFVVTALGLFNTSNASMPADALNYERAWRTSEILPFLANVALEALSCNDTAGGNSTAAQTNAGGAPAEMYVRALVNQAAIPIPGCAGGPGASCPLANFTDFVAQRQKLFTPFGAACGGANASNATDQLWVFEGGLPAGGAAVQVQTIALNGSVADLPDATSAAKKKSGGGAASGAVAERGARWAAVLAATVGAVGLVL